MQKYVCSAGSGRNHSDQARTVLLDWVPESFPLPCSCCGLLGAIAGFVFSTLWEVEVSGPLLYCCCRRVAGAGARLTASLCVQACRQFPSTLVVCLVAALQRQLRHRHHGKIVPVIARAAAIALCAGAAARLCKGVTHCQRCCCYWVCVGVVSAAAAAPSSAAVHYCRVVAVLFAVASAS